MERNELLEFVGKILDDKGVPFEFDDVNGRNVIVISFEDDETLPADITLTVDDPGFECTALNYFSIVSVGITSEIMEELLRILPDFNLTIRVGSFGVIADEGVLYYNHSLLLDGLEDEAVRKSIMIALDVAIGASTEGKKRLLPLLRGEKTAEELMQGDYQLLV